MNNEKTEKKRSILLILILVLVVLIIGLLIYSIIIANNTDVSEQNIIDTSTGETVPEELLALYEMSETERIKYYFNIYIDNLEDKNYEANYLILADEFKENYFKTVEDYEAYIERKYPLIITVSYDDIIRMGDYYVIDVTFLDLYGSTTEDLAGEPQKFVIYESNYNEYKISFQADE